MRWNLYNHALQHSILTIPHYSKAWQFVFFRYFNQRVRQTMLLKSRSQETFSSRVLRGNCPYPVLLNNVSSRYVPRFLCKTKIPHLVLPNSLIFEHKILVSLLSPHPFLSILFSSFFSLHLSSHKSTTLLNKALDSYLNHVSTTFPPTSQRQKRTPARVFQDESGVQHAGAVHTILFASGTRH